MQPLLAGLSRSLGDLGDAYHSSMRLRPLLTKALTSGAVALLGEVLGAWILARKRSNGPLNPFSFRSSFTKQHCRERLQVALSRCEADGGIWRVRSLRHRQAANSIPPRSI
jgi:hypothetical protein